MLPEIAKNVAKPLKNINAITMYGESNTSKKIEDITKSTSQTTTGLSDGPGIDIKSMPSGFLGRKVAPKSNDVINNVGLIMFGII